ncbi:hypothetical protein ZIOFF_035100 [Zingiber officinale]|uniref:Uncharacterized protein n=1 Tax=Zingiber officinale TaxID=94328 RepID=A0A8J5L2E9_ZINOF|nr:hypothetical protein ZIOFF_035100 [Zingiber officinale]
MSDVWEFKNGVMRIVEIENLGGRRPQQLLVYLQTEELITLHQMLEDRLRDEGLRDEGWVRYPEMPPELIKYHRGPDDNYLIFLPRDFSIATLLFIRGDVRCMGVQNGVMQIMEMENLGARRPQQLLVYLQTEELITSHQMLEDRLRDEGWVHYPEMPLELIEYHRGADDNYLISLPRDFSNFSLVISI